MDCPLFNYDRNCLFKRFETINFHFPSLTPEEKFKVLLCPVDAVAIKLVNRFIKNMFRKRELYGENNITRV